MTLTFLFLLMVFFGLAAFAALLVVWYYVLLAIGLVVLFRMVRNNLRPKEPDGQRTGS